MLKDKMVRNPQVAFKRPIYNTRITILTFPSASLIWIPDPNLVITVPVDAPASNGARPSAHTGLTRKLHVFSAKFLSLSTISNHLCRLNDVIKYGRRDLAKYSGTLMLVCNGLPPTWDAELHHSLWCSRQTQQQQQRRHGTQAPGEMSKR